MEANEMLTVTLQAQQWNSVLSILHDAGPYKLVHPLIQTIMMQFQNATRHGPNGELGEIINPN